MSVRIAFSTLNDSEKKKISSDLIFRPQAKRNFFRGKGRRPCYSKSTKPPLHGMILINDDLYLAFAYGLEHFPDRILPNNEQLPSSINFTGNLYDQQKPMVIDAWNNLQARKCTLLALHTGFGKTVVAACLSTYDPGLTLVLVESTTLLPQWLKTYEEFTDAKIWVVGQPAPSQANVIICMDTRLEKLPDSYLKRVKMVIIDEAHCFPTSTRYPLFLKIQPKYVIAATATPDRDDGLFKAMEAVCGTEKIIKISTKPFNVMRYNTGIKVPIDLNKQGTPDWAALTRKLCQNEDRNKLILETVQMNVQRGLKVLILTWRDGHAKYLEKEIAKLTIQVPLPNRSMSSFHEIPVSVDRMSGTKKGYYDSQVLVGTIAKIGKGFDERTCCQNFNGIRLDLLLLIGSMKSKILLEQVAGRVFRAEFPNIIHFCDNNSISKKHWNAASDWYASRNGLISSLDSPLANSKSKIKETPRSRANDQLAWFCQSSHPIGKCPAAVTNKVIIKTTNKSNEQGQPRKLIFKIKSPNPSEPN